MFKGSCVALVTPFDNGSVDYEALEKLIEWHIEEGTDCIVPCGCTGEAATLNHDEHREIIKFTLSKAKGRIKIMAGTGSNATWESIDLTKYAAEAGVDGVLIITPYYNKPTQEGLFVHYSTIAKEVDIPICLYNVPSRTGVNIAPQTVKRLAELDNIVAIKEAAGSVSQAAEIIKLCGDRIILLSGDDSLTYAMMSMGAKGVVSVLANIAPSAVKSITENMLNNKFSEGLELHYKWSDLMDILFIETNPGPVKYILGLMGRIKTEWRLPLVSPSEDSCSQIEKAVKSYGL